MDMSIERYVFQIDTPKVHSKVSSEQTERPSFKSELIKSELNLLEKLKKRFSRFYNRIQNDSGIQNDSQDPKLIMQLMCTFCSIND